MWRPDSVKLVGTSAIKKRTAKAVVTSDESDDVHLDSESSEDDKYDAQFYDGPAAAVKGKIEDVSEKVCDQRLYSDDGTVTRCR